MSGPVDAGGTGDHVGDSFGRNVEAGEVAEGTRGEAESLSGGEPGAWAAKVMVVGDWETAAEAHPPTRAAAASAMIQPTCRGCRAD